MINIYVDGRSFSRDGAGFTVEISDSHFKWRRSKRLDNMTTNQAEMKAIEYAILSIKTEFKKHEIVLYTKNRYIEMMFARTGDVWDKKLDKIDKNQSNINNIRSLLVELPLFRVQFDQGNKIISEISKNTAETVKSKSEVFTKDEVKPGLVSI